MSPDDTINAYIIDTQIRLFDDARHELQLTIGQIAERAKLPKPTVDAWAQGRNGLTLWGVKKLLRVKELGPYLSRLFEPEDYALVMVGQEADHDSFAAKCIELVQQTAAAHHPESECRERIGPNEHKSLNATRAHLRAVS